MGAVLSLLKGAHDKLPGTGTCKRQAFAQCWLKGFRSVLASSPRKKGMMETYRDNMILTIIPWEAPSLGEGRTLDPKP